MSDWQRGVDWLLAEYCRCRLWLDLHWCSWRAGVKGLSLCGLQGVERQVGSSRWTRWLHGIKCGPHGGKKRKTKSCMVSWLSLKPRSRRDDVATKSCVGLAWRMHRVRGVCGGSPENCQGYLVEPQNKVWRFDRQRRDPGAPRNFEVGDTRHDQAACIGRMRMPDGCAAVRWRTSCVD
jgi:hypothetical protein